MLSGTGAEPLSQSAAADRDVGDRQPVPRVLTWAVVKRIDPQLLNTWGHWWIELDDKESYGWWPSPCPMGWRAAMLGTRGCLNGIDGDNSGTPTRDAYHGDEPDHWFHPTLIADKSNDQVRAEIRAFAQSYVGGFRWQWWWLRQPAENCRTFQDDLFETVGLFEEPAYLYTRGSGCPFMFPIRRIKWGIIDAITSLWARVRGWIPSRRRTFNDIDPSTIERTSDADGESDSSPHPLADPKARARADQGHPVAGPGGFRGRVSLGPTRLGPRRLAKIRRRCGSDRRWSRHRDTSIPLQTRARIFTHAGWRSKTTRNGQRDVVSARGVKSPWARATPREPSRMLEV